MTPVLQLTGAAIILFTLASLAVPLVLGWRTELATLRPLTRKVFWTYAAYIAVTHLAFGLTAIVIPAQLVAAAPLLAGVCGFIALWWFARTVIQFTTFDRSSAKTVRYGTLLELPLVFAMLAFAAVFTTATVLNLR